jgi:hypothetical protein
MLIALMTVIVNIMISLGKKSTYNDKKTIISKYNMLMTDTAQILIALREYNYYINVENIENITTSRTSYYVTQLQN